MKGFVAKISWSLTVLGLLFSPILLIFLVPMAIGLGLDIADLCGLRLTALAVWAPVGLALLIAAVRRLPWDQATRRQVTQMPLDSAAAVIDR